MTATLTPGAPEKAPGRAARRKSHAGYFLLTGLAIWIFMGLVLDHLAHNLIVRGSWIVLGAALVPMVLTWAMAHRIRPRDTITAGILLKAFVIGGFFAFLIGASLDTAVGLFAPGKGVEPSLLSYALSGVVEEFSKAVVVIAIGWNIAKTLRNGLFIGGAVGAGFAVFETIGYIDFAPTILGGGQGVLEGTRFEAIMAVDRALTMPLGHPLWAALLGAAIFAAAAKTGRFRLTLGVAGAYLGVAVLHGLWDAGRVVLADVLVNDPIVASAATLPLEIVIGLIGGLIWLRVARKSRLV